MIPPQVTQEPAGRREIRGRVTDKETGQPLARVQVTLATSDGDERWSARTDDTGRYRFTGLPAGEYSGFANMRVSRPTHTEGFISGDMGRPLVLREGEIGRSTLHSREPTPSMFV